MYKKEILSLSPPAVPMWAAFYQEEDDSIDFSPIVTLALAKQGEEELWEDGEEYFGIIPVSFDNGYLEFDTEEIGNYLGLMLEPCATEARRFFDSKIERIKAVRDKGL